MRRPTSFTLVTSLVVATFSARNEGAKLDAGPLADLAARPHFAHSFTGSFGALFIELNVGGDARKAEGYFKTTTDLVTDPPASSGKTRFTITRQ